MSRLLGAIAVVMMLVLSGRPALAQDSVESRGQFLDPETAPPNFSSYELQGLKIMGSAFDPATGAWKLYAGDGRYLGTAAYDPDGDGGRGDWRIAAPDGRELGVFEPLPGE